MKIRGLEFELKKLKDDNKDILDEFKATIERLQSLTEENEKMRKEIKDMKIISSPNKGIKKRDYDSLDLQGLDDEINEADDNIMDVSESQTKDITLEEIVTKTAGF